MELIAHRAGNRPDAVASAVHADVVELDVHLRGDRLEVRHAKRLWATSRLWDRWYVLARDAPRWTLAEALASAGDERHVMLDLKGVSPRLTRAVRREIGARRPVTVSTKSWWLLAGFSRSDGVRTLRSAGNRFELAVLLLLPSSVRPDGVVVHQRLLDATTVRRLRRRAALVWSWGAGDRATVDRLVAVGVDGLILDDLELIRVLVDERLAAGG